VTKKIKIFEYGAVAGDSEVELHYPVREMNCQAKISCLSWNSYLKSHLASSDYEGVVAVWDVATGAALLSLDEHEKRVWSVDFCAPSPTRLVSGSDDTKSKKKTPPRQC
jgi:E3 ubiquitin-protein ligase RFWD2